MTAKRLEAPVRHLRIAGIQIALRLSGLPLRTFVESCSHWIPDIRRSRPERAPALTIDVGVGEPRLSYRRDGFELRSNSGVFHTCLDAALILSRYLERELNRQNRYSIHAGCVAVRSRAHLLLGGSGVGKTTIAAAWRRSDEAVRLLSGDRTVLREDLVVAGTTTLAFRNSAFDAALCPPGAQRRWEAWTSVAYPRDVFPTPYSVASLNLVRLTTGPAVWERVRPPDDFLRVYENVVHFGDVFPSVALDHMMPIPHFSTMASQARRIDFTRRLVDGREVWSVSGGLLEIVADLAQRASDEVRGRRDA